MVRPSRLPFFLTETGRRLVFYGSTTAVIGLFAGHYLPHTVGVGYLKDFAQAYKNGEKQLPSDKIQKHFDKAVTLLNLSEFEKKFISPFIVYGFDVYNAGSMKSRFGGIVGIPANFEYNSAADIEKQDVILQGRKINWSSEGGKLLEECLILNEDEQVFAICREILTLNTHKRFIQSVIPSAVWFFTYNLASLVNRRNNLYIRPFSLRCMLYVICGIFGFGVYSFATDITEVQFDTSVDKKLAALGPEMANAGARFYDKILKKNIAMRKLTGDDYYTAGGNINYMLRQKTVPLTSRKDFFVSGYKKFINKEETS
ncbi:transmembrane protein 177 [Wyeomyia smithii]|uniref:transmembrane protein 177 n=1 Tax=Wyeomyia smithii TaxID=174621 RepID=UPI002467F6C1|nr:transmembrane protein 177 [Wyeomyia smithii]